MWEINRVIRCDTWEELKRTAKRYQEMGFRCEVRGWQDIRENKLTVLDDWEDCGRVNEELNGMAATPTM